MLHCVENRRMEFLRTTGRLQREGERLTRTFQRKQQYFQDDVNVAQQDVINNIGRKLVDVLSQYSKENGYSVILDRPHNRPR